MHARHQPAIWQNFRRAADLCDDCEWLFGDQPQEFDMIRPNISLLARTQGFLVFVVHVEFIRLETLSRHVRAEIQLITEQFRIAEIKPRFDQLPLDGQFVQLLQRLTQHRKPHKIGKYYDDIPEGI